MARHEDERNLSTMESLFQEVESPVLRKLFRYLDSKDMSKVMEDFFSKHCDIFPDGYGEIQNEQRHEYYELYEEYKVLLEDCLEYFCEKEGISHKELYNECGSACATGSLLVGFLMSAMEYDSFFLNMSSYRRMEQDKQELRNKECKENKEMEDSNEESKFESKC